MKKNANPLPLESLHVMCVDDERQLREFMQEELPRYGHRVTTFADGASALAALGSQSFDCALVDLKMPGMNGLELIARLRESAPDLQTILLTGNADLNVAVQSMRLGAFDFLEKPCKLRELETALLRVADKLALVRQCRKLERQVEAQTAQKTTALVGSHPTMQELQRIIQRVAPTNSTVLILGETGTGKELVARSIHQQSTRAAQAFVAVNCGALPENLIESELFGHLKGAFTGADVDRLGLFEVANGGTLFLDEIGELPKAMQAKLLRVLESGEIRRVGEGQTRRVDCRIVCATHRDLPRMVQEGQFREDLMYRINTFQIQVPSLRQRRSDVPALAEALLLRVRPTAAGQGSYFTEHVRERLQSHTWPGNVRELANVIEHASVMCDRLPIDIEHLPNHLGQPRIAIAPQTISQPEILSLRDMEQRMIEAALERHHGNKTAAAQELGVSIKTLYNKLNAPPDRSAA
ncbi:MAG: sigma-54-dependent Fis family transcriptional regulator [Planctomycetaceae bacterium]|nr:sigma-54-dependent Fis family transcriptional regulator [Planctomycetaceae bacterium]